jgi:hypothetical protein
MKKYVADLVCLLFLISLIGCGAKENTTRREEKGEGAGMKNPSLNQEHQDVPSNIRFDTVQDINKFFAINGASGDKNAVEGSAGSIFEYETKSKAEQISTSMAGISFPKTDAGVNAEYYPSNQSIDSIYIIDGIQYCFMYFFDKEADWYYGDEPAFSNVQVGPYVMDFFEVEHPHNEGEYYLLGHMALDSIDLLIRIRGTQDETYEKFSFEAFDFVPLSSVGGDVVE